LFLYPGLANRSWKQLVVGAITVLAAVVIGGVLGHIASLNYPEESERLILQPEAKQTPLELLFQGHLRLALAVAVAVAVAVFVIGTFRVERWKTVLPAVLLLALGAAACVKLHYHIGAIALLFGTILWLRAGTLHNSRLPIVGAIVAVTALAQFYLLHGTGEFPGRTLIGAFVGSPSVWPTLRFVEFSLGGIAVLAVTVAFATCRLAGGRRIPLYFLFFAMAVWAPLVAIGLFRWDVALRYTLGMLPFFLLIAIAACTYLVQNVSWIASALQRPVFAATAGFMLIAIIVNPVAVWRTAQNDYRNHPDHKGAAEFIRSLNLDADDIIIAEDCINQTYYLGKVDYRLQNVLAARKHSVLRNGVLYGQYTSAPVIGSGRMLKDVLEREPVRNIYIIGNSEGAKNWLRQNRENGIAEVLASGHLEVIFVGRDRKTTVWRLRR
jgi:uncharacterized membrane protein YeaQ/YmgE (transglycosylase-associated protein family)